MLEDTTWSFWTGLDIWTVSMGRDGRQKAEDFSEKFLNVVCDAAAPLLQVLLPLEILFVLLLAVAFSFNPPGSAGRVMIYLTLPANIAVLVSTAGLMYACGTRHR